MEIGETIQEKKNKEIGRAEIGKLAVEERIGGQRICISTSRFHDRRVLLFRFFSIKDYLVFHNYFID